MYGNETFLEQYITLLSIKRSGKLIFLRRRQWRSSLQKTIICQYICTTYNLTNIGARKCCVVHCVVHLETRRQYIVHLDTYITVYIQVVWGEGKKARRIKNVPNKGQSEAAQCEHQMQCNPKTLVQCSASFNHFQELL